MLFTEFSFIFVFLPLTLCIYYALPSVRLQIASLIIASLVFYSAWNIYFVPMLAFAIVSNYLIALKLYKTQNKAWFIFGIVLALIPITYFKYSGLFANAAGLNVETGFFGEKLGSLLPLGISFYTFQQITYLADVNARKNDPGKFLSYAFFKLFFPQLIAGPILHYNQIVPQIGQQVDRERLFAEGAIYFAIGFVKKFFIADGFAAFSDPIYDGTGVVDTQAALIATLGYTFQLYFDFSGYSDMALGLARLFGFHLPWNFDSPYKARSISDFWRRWHMTLSRFLRDYLYIPMGGNRNGELQRYRNLILTMLIGGLWHGAAWTFVAWGALHGVALAINQLWDRYVRIRLFGLGWVLTFVLVALLWVLFRATSFDRAIEIYRALLDFGPLTEDRFWYWVLGGILLTRFFPNSHQIVEVASRKLQIPEKLSVPFFARRLGAYAAISSVALYSLTYAYYTHGIDQIIYPAISAPSDTYGVSNRSGDFRNNLWRKDLFTRPETHIAILGSSFASQLGRFGIEQSGNTVAVSETFAMGGNGILNGARAGTVIAAAGQAKVIVLGISPLNFGTTTPSMPFSGQCMDRVEPYVATAGFSLPRLPLSDCLGGATAALEYLSVFNTDRETGAYQFKNFARNIALSAVSTRNSFVPFAVETTAGTLAKIKSELEAERTANSPIPNPANGRNETFKWENRKIEDSLAPGGLAFTILKGLKVEAERAGAILIVYETPTSSEVEIYPAGFFDRYQSNIRQTLATLGIPYLDLSKLLPWTGGAMYDFIHSQPKFRPMIHQVILAWIYAPEILRASGLLDPKTIPDISGLKR